MLVFKPIEYVPLEKEVLLYWKHLDHFEKGFVSSVAARRYWLSIDGDYITTFPTHFTEVPCYTF